ncbi:MAG: hypothetical protein ABIZ80_23270, partial [Bryobacteraceae bacterium]
SGGKARRSPHDLRISSAGRLLWMPDGRILQDSYNGGLWVAAISRSGEVEDAGVRFTQGSGLERYPSANAAGSKVAFAGLQVNQDLWAVPIDGNQGKPRGEPQRLTEGPADSTYPTVSRDGRSLVYTSDRSGNWDLYLRDLETGKERTLTSFPEVAGRAEISPDGLTSAYTGRGIVSVVPTRGGRPEKICDDCGQTVLGWTPDSRQLIWAQGRPGALFLLGAHDGKKSPLLSHPEWDLHRGQISPDGRWITFNPKMGPTKSAIYVSPMRNGVAAGQKDWIAITDGEGDDASPMWSPDANLLYFVTGRSSFQDYWAVRLDPETKRPAGEPFEVLAFHNARRPALAAFGKAVTKDRFFWAMQEFKGNIWIAEKQPASR